MIRSVVASIGRSVNAGNIEGSLGRPRNLAAMSFHFPKDLSSPLQWDSDSEYFQRNLDNLRNSLEALLFERRDGSYGEFQRINKRLETFRREFRNDYEHRLTDDTASTLEGARRLMEGVAFSNDQISDEEVRDLLDAFASVSRAITRDNE
jgi:predicted nuclease with TOPRIM domain